jgi:3' exoribonuclease, RNase T-like
MLSSHVPQAEDPATQRAARRKREGKVDVYFSADVETDGPIPGPYSMLSFAIVYAGCFDGKRFERATTYDDALYRELRPISDSFEVEALRVNGLDRERLCREGAAPEQVMTEASDWIRKIAGSGRPVLVAYPLSFDWSWLYWYFVRFSKNGSPFNHSSCFDMKTAFALKAHVPIAEAGRSQLTPELRSARAHTHHALDDAIEQAEIFANLFEWEGLRGDPPR